METAWEARNKAEKKVIKARPAATGCRTRMTRNDVSTALIILSGIPMRVRISSGTTYPSWGPKQTPLLISKVGRLSALSIS